VPGRAPVPNRRTILKALALGACALAFLVTPAAAHVTPTPKGELEAQLRRHVRSLRHDRKVISFFEHHRWLLSDSRFQHEARRQLRPHRAHLAVARRRIAATRAAIARRERQRQLVVARTHTPRTVICRVFGPYCKEALAVASCESGLQTIAQNGQYLGLFQLGSSERRLFGHGPAVEEQVRAAYRYFLATGRDWSPWSCKPWW
jgi:hypothetical protein